MLRTAKHRGALGEWALQRTSDPPPGLSIERPTRTSGFVIVRRRPSSNGTGYQAPSWTRCASSAIFFRYSSYSSAFALRAMFPSQPRSPLPPSCYRLSRGLSTEANLRNPYRCPAPVLIAHALAVKEQGPSSIALRYAFLTASATATRVVPSDLARAHHSKLRCQKCPTGSPQAPK